LLYQQNFLNLIVSLLNNIIMKILRSHKDLEVYQLAFRTSMEIFHISKSFPKDEIFSMTSQIRRSSRSVSANIAEAFRKRRYEKAFVSKLSDSEAESAETQVWLSYSLECGYLSETVHQKLFNNYDNIIGKIVNMINQPDKWSI
jgi:four helix bundle protein